jgi:hypothetical protein
VLSFDLDEAEKLKIARPPVRGRGQPSAKINKAENPPLSSVSSKYQADSRGLFRSFERLRIQTGRKRDRGLKVPR